MLKANHPRHLAAATAVVIPWLAVTAAAQQPLPPGAESASPTPASSSGLAALPVPDSAVQPLSPPTAPAPSARSVAPPPTLYAPPSLPPAVEPVYARHLALGVGTATGLGIIAGSIRARLNYFALEGAVGYVPILLMSSGDSQCSAIAFEMPLQWTASAIFFFFRDQRRFVPGLRASALYNSKLGWGAMVGFEGEFRINQPLSLGFGAGLKVQPQGADWARERLQQEVGSSCRVQNDPVNVVFPYLNFQLLFYAL